MDSIIESLRTSQLGCGLDQGNLQRLAASIRVVEVPSGQTVFRQNDPGDSLFVVTSGRIRMAAQHAGMQDAFVEYMAEGEHFGEQATLTSDRRSVTATAAMDSTLLKLSRQSFEELMDEIPRLAANLSKAMSFRLQRESSGRTSQVVPRVIGVVNTSWKTHGLVPVVSRGLSQKNQPIRVVADGPFLDVPQGYRVEVAPEGFSSGAQTEWIRDQLSRQSSYEGHTFVSLSRTASPDTLGRVLSQCDQVWWLAEPKYADDTKRRLSELLADDPRLAERIRWVWVLDESTSPETIPTVPEQLSGPDFKVILDQPGSPASRLQKQSISRLMNDLRNTRIGIALGGGAARGLAHLGVLKALEKEGIYADIITGTSAGALMALPYAYGWDLDFIGDMFARDLTPSWPFRLLPRGKEWFMLYKYRTRGWESMLRNHLGNVRLEQLLTPLSTVTADLITGREVVRDTGDAVRGVLESINLPGISRPILRDGMALVDGGTLNNVPTDLLPTRGADIVVGVDISSRLSHTFGGNVPGMSAQEMKRTGQLETIMRTNEIQDHAITRLRTSKVDFRVDVDASAFSFADFTQATALSELGEQQAEALIPQLKQQLAEHERTSSATTALRFVCPCRNKQEANRDMSETQTNETLRRSRIAG